METPECSGLKVVYDYVSRDEEDRLIAEIDANEWMTTTGKGKAGRRVQHYGFKYDYSGRTKQVPTTPFPPHIQALAQRLVDDGLFHRFPDQCIVNEYSRKQGIGAHTDHEMFGPIIVTVSLGEDVVMDFTYQDKVYHGALLKRRSMAQLTKSYRYLFKHSIAPRVNYTYEGVKYTKGENYRRISVTFRYYRVDNDEDEWI